MAAPAPPPISVPATAFATALSAAACPALLTPNLLGVLLPREADGLDLVEALIRPGQEHDARNIAVSEAIEAMPFIVVTSPALTSIAASVSRQAQP
jgi:hypothetical protein